MPPVPVDPSQAAALLQYGALGVVVLLILIGSAFGFRMLGSFESAVDRLGDRIAEGFQGVHANVDRTRHALVNQVMQAEENISQQIEQGDRATLPAVPRPETNARRRT